MMLTPRDLIVASTAVRFASEPKTYPIWREYNIDVLSKTYGSDIPNIPSREELQEVATKLLKVGFSSFTPEEQAEALDEIRKVLRRTNG